MVLLFWGLAFPGCPGKLATKLVFVGKVCAVLLHQLSVRRYPHLLLSDMLWCHCCWVPTAIDQYFLPPGHSAANFAGCCRSMGHMDGRLTIYIDPASHTLLAVSISSSYFIASAQICLSANA